MFQFDVDFSQMKLTPILKNNPPDLEEYKIDYGSLGPLLYNAVLKARSTQSSGSVSNVTSLTRQTMSGITNLPGNERLETIILYPSTV